MTLKSIINSRAFYKRLSILSQQKKPRKFKTRFDCFLVYHGDINISEMLYLYTSKILQTFAVNMARLPANN